MELPIVPPAGAFGHILMYAEHNDALCRCQGKFLGLGLELIEPLWAYGATFKASLTV